MHFMMIYLTQFFDLEMVDKAKYAGENDYPYNIAFPTKHVPVNVDMRLRKWTTETFASVKALKKLDR